MGIIVAVIGGLLKLYSDTKADRAKQRDQDEQADTDVRKQGMLSADAQLVLLWKDKEQRDAVVLAQQAKIEQLVIDKADLAAQVRVKDWELKSVTAERDRLQVHLDELTRPRTSFGEGVNGG